MGWFLWNLHFGLVWNVANNSMAMGFFLDNQGWSRPRTKNILWLTCTCAPGVQRDPNKSESMNEIPNRRYKTESNCATECHQWRCEYKYDMTRDSVPLTKDSLVITLTWDFQWPSFWKPIRTQHMSCSSSWTGDCHPRLWMAALYYT
jgi:hypothetical protein